MHKFKKSQRILKRKDFTNKKTAQRKFCSKGMVLVFKKHQNVSMRLGLIVSKKVGNSVTRNLVKRRIRDIFRQLSDDQRQPGWDLIVIARNFAAKMQYKHLNYDVNRIVDKQLTYIKNNT
jgi:ribonuclease P protein component